VQGAGKRCTKATRSGPSVGKEVSAGVRWVTFIVGSMGGVGQEVESKGKC